MDRHRTITSPWICHLLFHLIHIVGSEATTTVFYNSSFTTEIPLLASHPKENASDTFKRCWTFLESAYPDRKSDSTLSLTTECGECFDGLYLKSTYGEWMRLSGKEASTIKCFSKVPEFRDRIVVDLFWVTSVGEDVLIYRGNSSDVVITWDYLSSGQKAVETIFMCLGIVLLTVVVVGNALVLITIMSNLSRQDTDWIMRVSLALSDLFRGVFCVATAVRNTLWIMTSGFSKLYSKSGFPEHLYGSFFVCSGFLSFCGVVLETTSLMSFQCIAFLATKRFFLCKNSEDRIDMKGNLVKGIAVGAWSVGVLVPLTILFTSEESPGYSVFDSLTKFSLLSPKGGFGYVLHNISILYMGGLFIFTVMTLAKTTETFRVSSEAQLAKIIKHSSSSRVKQQRRDDHHILMTLRLTLALYVVSAAPRFLLLIPGLQNGARFLYFIFWWVFVLDSSWHWYILNVRSRLFQDCMVKLMLRFPCWPLSIRTALEARLLPDVSLSMDSFAMWQQIDAKINKRDRMQSSEEPV